jgi:hypothetical protein
VPKAPTIAEPLTDQDLRDLNRAQYILNQLLPQLDKAEAAGRDVTDLRLRRDDLASQVAQIKAAYFPSAQ